MFDNSTSTRAIHFQSRLRLAIRTTPSICALLLAMPLLLSPHWTRSVCVVSAFHFRPSTASKVSRGVGRSREVLRMMGAFGGISSQPFSTPATPPKTTSRSGDENAAYDLAEFRRLGLGEETLEGLRKLGIKEPSVIQRLAIPAALKGDDVAFSASTGSGKTLAYLLPIMQELKWQEAVEGKERQTCRPRALILVPTRELVTQVLEVIKSLSHVIKLSSCGLHGGEDFGVQRRRLGGMVDLVVASPGRLLQHYEKGHVFFSQVAHVVVDEMDTMLKDGFGPDLKRLMVPLEAKSKREKVQYLMATATLTPAVKRLMAEEGNFPKTRFLQSEDAHKSLPTMRHIMLDTKGGDKVQLLLDVVSQGRQNGERAMIFCNTVQSCRAAEHALRELALPSACYHGDMHSEERAAALEKFKSGEVSFLVCTDIASRGLDMPFVEHVVMFDFPLNPIEYLHRSGRTARMGAKGKVTSLLTKRDKVLASAVQTAVAKGLPLDSLSARKRDYESGGKLSGLSSGKMGASPSSKGNRHAKYVGNRQRSASGRAGSIEGPPEKGARGVRRAPSAPSGAQGPSRRREGGDSGGRGRASESAGLRGRGSSNRGGGRRR